MKRVLTVICMITLCLSVLSGCKGRPLPDLPCDPIAFDMDTFADAAHDDALFGSITYNGRVYIPYGTINNRYTRNRIASCIGYIIQNANSSSVIDPDNTNDRIYTLTEDPSHDFLMEYDETIRLMNQPSFFRAVDTVAQDIEIPAYIEPLGYEFWGE